MRLLSPVASSGEECVGQLWAATDRSARFLQG
jgi:hypothetical protein